MNRKIYYTIERNTEVSEKTYIVSLAFEDEYKDGFTASYHFEEDTWEKIETVGLAELFEGVYESFAENLKDLTDALDSVGFVCGSIKADVI